MRIDPGGRYALREAAAFWRGFVPGRGTAEESDDRLVLAFRADRTFEPVIASLAEKDGAIEARVDAHDPDSAARQIARMLSLDVDPAPWDAVLAKDEKLAIVAARWPGFRPVCFASPWEAAVWGVIVQGIGMARASKLRATIAARDGERVAMDGVEMRLFPPPRTVLDRDLEGLDGERQKRLRAVAEAALRGELEADRLRAMKPDEALAALRTIRGIGEWTAGHILYRGAALADGEPFHEPRVRRGIALAYGLGETPDETECVRIAEAWKPYRMWGAILMVRNLSGTKGWHGPEKRGQARRSPRKRA